MIGTGELLVILGLVLVLFGGKKLPEFARNLGEGIREFKKACNPNETIDSTPKGCGKQNCCQDKQIEKENDST